MMPVDKALWFIEAHSADDISLDDVAAAGGMSRFAMTRAFGAATGRSVIRYLRARRLTEAARSLAAGSSDILTVALDAGYGSHEAFTRAFRDQFGITPERVRGERRLDKLALVEPIKMDETLLAQLDPPRLVDGKAMLVAGLVERYDNETSGGIPAQWQRFNPHFGHVPGQVGNAAYGVCYNCDALGNFDYLCDVELRDFSDVPTEFVRLRIPAHRYAVFAHRSHISGIRRTFNTIFNRWLPESGQQMDDAPLFEQYGERFDPQTGEGGLEIWVPLKA
jgi:AraC family transcriptional regulator